MSSRATKDRKRRADEIERVAFPAPIACDYCFEQSLTKENFTCLIMPNAEGEPVGKCAECSRIGRTCVRTSWSSLDRTRDDIDAKLEAAQIETEALLDRLDDVRRRVARYKRIKSQADTRAREKFDCLVRAAEAEGEETRMVVQEASALDFGLDHFGVDSPLQWTLPTDPSDPVGTSQSAQAS